MKKMLFCIFPLFLVSCGGASVTQEKASSENKKEDISEVIDQWHEAAGNANFEDYFSLMAKGAVFIGTDPTENWYKPEFQEWAKPYFDRGKAWDFSSLERNIFLPETGDLAWFDELLDTQMGICRGSGVVVREKGLWKIQHYVLSIAIPNENVSEVIQLKKEFDKNFITPLKSE